MPPLSYDPTKEEDLDPMTEEDPYPTKEEDVDPTKDNNPDSAKNENLDSRLIGVTPGSGVRPYVPSQNLWWLHDIFYILAHSDFQSSLHGHSLPSANNGWIVTTFLFL